MTRRYLAEYSRITIITVASKTRSQRRTRSIIATWYIRTVVLLAAIAEEAVGTFAKANEAQNLALTAIFALNIGTNVE